MEIHKNDRDKRNVSNIKIREPIQEMSKPSTDKTQNTIVVCITVTIYYFLMVLPHIVFEFQAFHCVFLTNIPRHIDKKFQSVYVIFLTTVFAISLNPFHKNTDVKNKRFNGKTFSTEIFQINRVRCNYDEIAEMPYPHFDQNYSKYIFRSTLNQSLQLTKENKNNNSFIGFIL